MNTIARTIAAGLLGLAANVGAASAAEPPKLTRSATHVTTAEGVQLYYKDWGPRDGQGVSFSHGWPLNSDSWESQMVFLAS